MIVRLVQQQHFRPGDGQARQGHQLLLAAAERLAGQVVVGLVQAQMRHQRAHAALVLRAAKAFVFGEDALLLRQRMRQASLVIVDRRLTQALLQPGQALLHGRQRGRQFQRRLQQAAARGQRDLLRQIADARPRQALHQTAVRRQSAADDAQQAGLADAIGADQSAARATVNAPGEVREDFAGGVGQCDVVETDALHTALPWGLPRQARSTSSSSSRPASLPAAGTQTPQGPPLSLRSISTSSPSKVSSG